MGNEVIKAIVGAICVALICLMFIVIVKNSDDKKCFAKTGSMECLR